MSFYSVRNAKSEINPGRIHGDASCGLCERVPIEVKKVYDACMQQDQLDNVLVTVCKVRPANVTPVPPFTFVSCRSTATSADITDLVIERLADRENFARVRGNVHIPIQIVFVDNAGNEFTATAYLTVFKDVILFVPDASVIPFELDDIVSAICVTGSYVGNNTFSITVCVTIILKIVAEVVLLIPAYGFCSLPPCEEFAENVCDEFFGLPIFPPQLEDGFCDC